MACLLEVVLDGGVRGGEVLHSIAEGEARKGNIVACFYGCKPGGRDWVTSRDLLETDKSAEAGEVVRIGSLGR